MAILSTFLHPALSAERPGKFILHASVWPSVNPYVGNVCRNALILLTLAALPPFKMAAAAKPQDQADALYQQGLKAQRRGDILHAYLLFAQAARLDPGDLAIMADRNQSHAVLMETMKVSDASNAPDPDLAFYELMRTQGPAKFDEFGPTAPVPHLAYTGGKQSFNLTADAKSIIEKVGAAFGVQMVFASDWQGPPPFPLHTGELDLFAAFGLIEEMTGSLIVPIDSRTAYVTRDTPQHRTELVPVVSMAVPIPQRFSVQEAQEMVQAVQQVLEIRRAQVDPARRTVFFRDAASKVLLAEKLLSDISRLRAQVEIDVELDTYTKDYSMNVGFQLPTTSQLVNFGTFLGNAISPGNFTNYLSFGGGKTLFGIGVTAAQMFANMSNGITTSLLTAQVKAIDGQPASLNVGTRYPIASAQFLGATAATTPTPTVTYQDLGLVLKVTPTVHAEGEMTLDVDAAFTTLGATSNNGIPSIAQRKYQGKVRLHSGEWAFVAGLTTTDDSTSYTGVAGLSRLPLLGHLFRANTITHDVDDTLIILKPHIISLPPWDFPVTEMQVGTESKFLSLY